MLFQLMATVAHFSPFGTNLYFHNLLGYSSICSDLGGTYSVFSLLSPEKIAFFIFFSSLCNFILNTKISVKRKCAQQFTTIESIDTFSYLIIVDSSMTNRCSLGLLLLLITNVRMVKAHASSHPNVTQN